MEINIRKALIEDTEYLDQLLTMLIQDEKNYDNNINENFIVEEFYKTKILKDEHYCLVAEINNQIIGYIYGYLIDNNSICINHGAKLDAIYIVEKYRNLGIAKKLIQEFKSWSKDNGASYIEVKVFNKNNKAFNLYKNENFNEIKTTLYYEIK